MAYNANPYGGLNAYREVGVKTASQGKLVVMLYEGAVSNLEKAKNLIGPEGKIAANHIESYGNYIQKAMDIISELEASLDMAKGGDIAKNLMSLYIYFNKQLLEVTISHDVSKIEFVMNMMNELHESWVSASASTANTAKMTPGTSTLNITG